MRNYDLKKTKGVWFEFPADKTMKFLIRPLSIFALKRLPKDENDEFSPQEYWTVLNNSLIDWKGILEGGQPVKFNEENKKTILDLDQDISAFIVKKATELREQAVVPDKEAKN